MKAKKMSKRLELKKETIVHLDNDKLAEIQGGFSTRSCVLESLLSCLTEPDCNTNYIELC